MVKFCCRHRKPESHKTKQAQADAKHTHARTHRGREHNPERHAHTYQLSENQASQQNTQKRRQRNINSGHFSQEENMKRINNNNIISSSTRTQSYTYVCMYLPVLLHWHDKGKKPTTTIYKIKQPRTLLYLTTNQHNKEKRQFQAKKYQIKSTRSK